MDWKRIVASLGPQTAVAKARKLPRRTGTDATGVDAAALELGALRPPLRPVCRARAEPSGATTLACESVARRCPGASMRQLASSMIRTTGQFSG